MHADQQGYCWPSKTTGYNYDVPTPPRIVVPPPPLDAHAVPQIPMQAAPSSEFRSLVDYRKVVSQHAALDWTYERRRQAQMVLPYLYLGPSSVVRDETFLQRLQPIGSTTSSSKAITAIFGICQKDTFHTKVMANALERANELGIETRMIALADNQELIHSFPRTTEWINEHLTRAFNATGQLGQVLVVCESGNERSAGTIAAYLMETHVDTDYIRAMQFVQAQRFCANFDDSMKCVLQAYWDILCAKRQVAEAKIEFDLDYSDRSNLRSNDLKRSLQDEQASNTSHASSQPDDLVRFQSRHFVPFTDKAL